MSGDTVRIILPKRASNYIDLGLVELTEAIAGYDPDAVSHGLLGGQFGYGAHWENDTFMMHPYCWCEEDDCPWCARGEANFRYKPTGFEVQWYKWIGRSMECPKPVPTMKEWAEIVETCLRSLEDRHV